MNRRHFLHTSAAALGLPWLESLGGFAHAADAKSHPRRLLLIGVPLGLYREALVPKESGEGYTTTEYLSIIDEFRDRFTIISGLDHPGVGGGHSAQPRLFTGMPSNKRNVRSLDQYLAGKIGQSTRFDTLALSAGANDFGWTDGGTQVPAEAKMANVYARLFLDESKATAEKVTQQIGQGKSIMDLVQRQAKGLKPKLSQADQDKLEEYFESVRETERRLVKSESWVHTPKPKVDAPAPKDPADRAEIITQLRNVCDMTQLAFQTDSTRIVTFGYFQQNNVKVDGVTNGYHPLSHHGQDPENIAQLKLIEKELFKELKTLLTNLKHTKEGDGNLLDRTTIIVTSNLGNASNHSTKDLPVLVLGGGFQHGQHLAFEPSTVPLANLYVSVLNQFGVADKSFATSTGPLKGFVLA
ncbi:MAG: DUF1552 domain-containing protein [Verrucomicrobiaceae bacterium]|nr:DUF1552 domain-containing protein [Verrucomicrobiaceae bacterium]